jgi:hypothetical protein
MQGIIYRIQLQILIPLQAKYFPEPLTSLKRKPNLWDGRINQSYDSMRKEIIGGACD